MLFATIANRAQLPNAMVLARSAKLLHPDASTILCLVGDAGPFRHPAYFDDAVFVTPKRPGDEFGSLAPYKAYFLHTLLQRYDEPVIFLDPHTRLYAPIHELIHELDYKELIAVPYLLEPQSNAEDEIERLQKGILHAGLLSVRPSPHTRRFTGWWLERVAGSHFGSPNKPDSEHRWLTLAANPFGIHLFKHPAYHLTAWNMHEQRRMLHVEGGTFLMHGAPLKTACFEHANGRLNRQLESLGNPALYRLVQQYAEECASIMAAAAGKETVS